MSSETTSGFATGIVMTYGGATTTKSTTESGTGSFTTTETTMKTNPDIGAGTFGIGGTKCYLALRLALPLGTAANQSN